ncbi:fimbrial protein [Serratia sp. (in: enterobacteria)]|uniref:fimbrial protein n=1 Tax=Serratia sp. (in: enterobacteria) TaxID=616 RepID=UPI0039892F58
MKRIIGKCYGVTRRSAWVSALFLLLGPASVATAADNVRFYGALVAEPCVITPGQEEISLDFGTIVDKTLYQHQRTAGQRFELHLAKCDLSLGKTVTVRFMNQAESLLLPGLLAPDSGGQAKGIAIGLETLDATPLPINQASGKYTLQAGSNIIVLKAYVQGEAKAIANKTIERGPFSATATFRLDYE